MRPPPDHPNICGGAPNLPSAEESGDSILLSIVRMRRSCRRYAADRPVPRALLAQCLEAARLAPSACNRQPWRFIVVVDSELRAAVADTCLLPGIRRDWIQDAPVLVVLAAVPEVVTHRLAPLVSGVPYWLIDVGIAGEHFVLAAAEAGLGTCWIGWFRERAVKRLFRLGAGVRVAALLTVGYPAESPGPPRPRRDLSEIAFENEWGRPFSPETPGAPAANA